MHLKRLVRFGRIYEIYSKHLHLLLLIILGLINASYSISMSTILERLDTFAQRRFSNSTSSGNPLWNELIDRCGSTTSFSCVQSSIFNYLDSRILSSNFFITDGIYFVRNSNKYGDLLGPHHPTTSQFYSVNSSLSLYNKSSLLSPKSSTANQLTTSPFVVTPSNVDSYLESIPKTSVLSNTTVGDSNERVEKQAGDLNAGVEKQGSTEPLPDVESTTLPTNFEEEEKEEEEEADTSFGEFVDSVEEAENTIGGEKSHREDRSFTPDGESHRSIHDLSDVLYEKGLSYLMTHDLQVHLPQMMFGGGRVKISPKGFDEDGGAIIKLNIDPDPEQPAEGRIFKKFIQKLFKKKLMSSFMALMLIMKLLKIKMMFLLPLIVGVGTAKKILLKVLLFLFPALSHLFKLCSYYHHHAAKFHLHHHKVKVKHHHHHIPVPVPVPAPPKHVYHHHHSPPPTYEEPEYPGPPIHGSFPGDSHEVEPPGPYDAGPEIHGPSGPGSGPYYPRNDVAANTMQQHSDEFASWGLNELFSNTESPGVYSAVAQSYAHLFNPQYPQASAANNPNAIPTAAPVPPHAQSPSLNSFYQGSNEKNFNTGYKTQQSKGSTLGVKGDGLSTYYSSNDYPNRYATATATTASPALQPVYDSFYSPILERIDDVLLGMGVSDEPCKERVICSMYKTPARFSPHSNLVSAELSRDPTELQRPSYTNAAVVRFYKYVQAARDGQDFKDCLRLYPSCAIKTE
nr:PREDICTED: uncharacterized protein LOC109035039 isoform X1 [Bemisia tabaci]